MRRLDGKSRAGNAKKAKCWRDEKPSTLLDFVLSGGVRLVPFGNAGLRPAEFPIYRQAYFTWRWDVRGGLQPSDARHSQAGGPRYQRRAELKPKEPNSSCVTADRHAECLRRLTKD